MDPQEERLSTAYAIPLVLVLVGLLLFMSLLHGQRDITLLTILLFVVAVGAKTWSMMSLAGLEYKSVINRERLFPGESFTLKIRLENTKWLPVWVRVRLSEIDSKSRDSGLLWRQRVDFDWELTAPKRGIYPIGPPRLLVGDLLGFFPKEKKTEARQIIVYPRIVHLKHLPIPELDFFGTPGTKSPVQDPVYILGTRDYQHSRPARYIHWKASARHNRLQEKIFEPAEQSKVLIAMDVEGFSGTCSEEAFESALEIVASLALQFDRKGYAFGFVTNGKINGIGTTILPVARNPRQLPTLLETLARLTMTPGKGLIHKIIEDLSLPQGTSAVLLVCEGDSSTLTTKETLERMKIPSLLLVSRVSSTVDEHLKRFKGMIHNYDEVRFDGKGLE